jgi:hypothetical protein
MSTNAVIGLVVAAVVVAGGGYLIWQRSNMSPETMHDDTSMSHDSGDVQGSGATASSSDMQDASGTMMQTNIDVSGDAMMH